MAIIAHLSSVHQPFDTRVFRKQCCSLAKAGYEVHWVVRHDEDMVVDGVKIAALQSSGGRLARMTGTVASLWRRARTIEADLYHFHDPELLLVGLALRLSGKPVVYDAHENYAAQIQGKPWISPPLRRPAALVAGVFEMLLAKAMSAVVVAGRDIEERFAGQVDRVVRIENFPILDEKLFALRDPEVDQFTFINFGGVWSARVTGEQVEALGMLPEKSPIRLVLGGRVFEPALDSAIRTLPGWSKVESIGQVDRDAMIDHLCSSSAAVILYSDSPNHHSIRSNRVYEAMAAGLPVIVSDFAEWSAFIAQHECGIAVDPTKPEAIAAAFQQLAENPIEAQAMGSRGQEAVRSIYNWDMEFSKIQNLYTELLTPTPKGGHS